jgi:hypothetical protein
VVPFSFSISKSRKRMLDFVSDAHRQAFLGPVNGWTAILTGGNPQQTRCPVCGQEFVPPAVVAAIQERSQESGLGSQNPASSIQIPLPLSALPAPAPIQPVFRRRGRLCRNPASRLGTVPPREGRRPRGDPGPPRRPRRSRKNEGRAGTTMRSASR